MPATAGQSTPETAPPPDLQAPAVALADLRTDEVDWVVPAGWGAAEPMTRVVVSETERRLRFRGLPQAVGAARRVLRDWERHFDPVLFYDLSLCVSELVTNRVQHGDASSAEEIELAVQRGARLVRAEISERSADVILTAPPAMASDDWGMFIVDRVADRWGVDHRDGTRVWCEIDLAPDGRSRGSHVGASAL